MKKLISLILVAMLCLMSVGCADTPDQTGGEEREYYSKMTNVQTLNTSDFDMMFRPLDTDYCYVIRPRYSDELLFNYSWYYYGQNTLFEYTDKNKTYERFGQINMSLNYPVTLSHPEAFGECKYMIYAEYRHCVYFIYTFRIDWATRKTYLDGGISFTYPEQFDWGWYWQDYQDGKIETISEHFYER